MRLPLFFLALLCLATPLRAQSPTVLAALHTDFAAPFRYVPARASAPGPIAAPAAARYTSSIEVQASSTDPNPAEGLARRITPAEIAASAGTFGDPSRYLQTLAGVVSGNDQRNDFLIRGGNPSENAFLIDNIEIPSINQLALSDSTGGFVSMLDAEALTQLTLHTDAYDSRFDQRLSSIIELSTRPTGQVERHTTSELGLAGFGGSITRPLGHAGSYFLSARQSVLQYVTDDIGMNGVPIYRNAFARAEKRLDERNSVWGISLTGIDSIQMRPSADDTAETSPFNIDYKGWRNTTGLNWQHVFSPRSFAVFSLAHAAQSQSIQQQDQLQANALIYDERTSDNISTFKADWTLEVSPRLQLTAGVRESIDQLHYIVNQPIGLQNPYSQDPAPLGATALDRGFAPASSAAYAQFQIMLPRHATLVLGERGSQWALGGHAAATPRALLSVPVLGRTLHLGYSEYAQLPATLFLLSFSNAATLEPIRSRQFTGGLNLADTARTRVTLELYRKQYTRYPVATGFPSLSLANIADTFGQAFLTFPMSAKGTGLAQGIELSSELRPTPRLNLTATATYARSWYSGLDGILRRGNYDLPFAANLSSVYHVGRNLTLSSRYSLSSGRPYTPDDLPLSLAQNRDVYDLTRVNGVRSTGYHRLDLRIEQTRHLGVGSMTWHLGLENALNNKNFYSQSWTPRANPPSQTEQDQMPRFPDGGLKYSF